MLHYLSPEPKHFIRCSSKRKILRETKVTSQGRGGGVQNYKFQLNLHKNHIEIVILLQSERLPKRERHGIIFHVFFLDIDGKR